MPKWLWWQAHTQSRGSQTGGITLPEAPPPPSVPAPESLGGERVFAFQPCDSCCDRRKRPPTPESCIYWSDSFADGDYYWTNAGGWYFSIRPKTATMGVGYTNPPPGSGIVKAVNTNGSVLLTKQDFADQIEDYDGEGAYALSITRLPSNGAMRLNGVNLYAAQQFSLSALIDPPDCDSTATMVVGDAEPPADPTGIVKTVPTFTDLEIPKQDFLDNIPDDKASYVRITRLPEHGTLRTSNGDPVSTGQTFLLAGLSYIKYRSDGAYEGLDTWDWTYGFAPATGLYYWPYENYAGTDTWRWFHGGSDGGYPQAYATTDGESVIWTSFEIPEDIQTWTVLPSVSGMEDGDIFRVWLDDGSIAGEFEYSDSVGWCYRLTSNGQYKGAVAPGSGSPAVCYTSGDYDTGTIHIGTTSIPLGWNASGLTDAVSVTKSRIGLQLVNNSGQAKVTGVSLTRHDGIHFYCQHCPSQGCHYASCNEPAHDFSLLFVAGGEWTDVNYEWDKMPGYAFYVKGIRGEEGAQLTTIPPHPDGGENATHEVSISMALESTSGEAVIFAADAAARITLKWCQSPTGGTICAWRFSPSASGWHTAVGQHSYMITAKIYVGDDYVKGEVGGSLYTWSGWNTFYVEGAFPNYFATAEAVAPGEGRCGIKIESGAVTVRSVAVKRLVDTFEPVACAKKVVPLCLNVHGRNLAIVPDETENPDSQLAGGMEYVVPWYGLDTAECSYRPDLYNLANDPQSPFGDRLHSWSEWPFGAGTMWWQRTKMADFYAAIWDTYLPGLGYRNWCGKWVYLSPQLGYTTGGFSFVPGDEGWRTYVRDCFFFWRLCIMASIYQTLGQPGNITIAAYMVCCAIPVIPQGYSGYLIDDAVGAIYSTIIPQEMLASGDVVTVPKASYGGDPADLQAMYYLLNTPPNLNVRLV